MLLKDKSLIVYEQIQTTMIVREHIQWTIVAHFHKKQQLLAPSYKKKNDCAFDVQLPYCKNYKNYCSAFISISY